MNSEANARRIAMVESCFGSSGQPLNEPGRVLVGEGVLTKMCRKKPKPRQFFLFNDILVYGNIVLNKKKYNKQHIIPLEEVQLASLDDEGQFRNGWLIKTPTKSFAVYAATSTEKAEWMAHINKCVSDLLRKSGKKAAETHAAVWVPDSDTHVCMHCKKTQFTLINRRHHCRKCGKVVCGPCSSKKVVLAHQSNKPLRVCLTCHDELSSSTQGHQDTLNSNSDSDEPLTIAILDPQSAPVPAPPPRRRDQAAKTQLEVDPLDLECDLFGDPSEDQDEDALPPTLWWDDIDLQEPIVSEVVGKAVKNESDEDEEGVKGRPTNDSSGDDDSDEDTDDAMQSPQAATETMTFYEGGEASNGDSLLLDGSSPIPAIAPDAAAAEPTSPDNQPGDAEAPSPAPPMDH